MWNDVIDRLLTVKSITTFILTIVFAVLAVKGAIEPKDVLTVYLVIIGFYFGTQNGKQEVIRNELGAGAVKSDSIS